MTLKTENYIYFFTASGFFIGLAYSAWATNDAFDMLLYTLEITLFFYLFVHLIIINFVDVKHGAKAMPMIISAEQHDIGTMNKLIKILLGQNIGGTQSEYQKEIMGHCI